MKFVLELHCTAPDSADPDDRLKALVDAASEANVVLMGLGGSVDRWGLRGHAEGAHVKGPYDMRHLERVPAERRGLLRLAIEKMGDGPFGWRQYPYSPTDYLTDLWTLLILGGSAAVAAAARVLSDEATLDLPPAQVCEHELGTGDGCLVEDAVK